MRVLLRRMARENWQIETLHSKLNDQGVGHAVIAAKGPERTYSLVAFSHDLPDEQRTDRVIAEAWDTTFALYDGIPDDTEIERLSKNVPLQEKGRISARELTLSRANKSSRLFGQVVEALSEGRQPDKGQLEETGYLMRTTAVYGSGKFGAADRETIAGRPEFQAPFQAEMLTVYLIRLFVFDLVDHLAKVKGGEKAVRLSNDRKRRLGIGNSTGLGMAPFIVNHPQLFHAWVFAKETALARVLAVREATDQEIQIFTEILVRTRALIGDWKTKDPALCEKLRLLEEDLERLSKRADAKLLSGPSPWVRLYRFAEETLGLEAQELLASMVLEPYGRIVDDLADTMSVDEKSDFPIDGSRSVGEFRELIEGLYDFALQTDFSQPSEQARFWYVSEAKLEPRLGERFDEDGSELESPLSIARDISRLYEKLAQQPSDTLLAGFLLKSPEHRHVARRVGMASRCSYMEIQDNLLSAAMRPIDMLRAKLSFFGATKFDPRSDRWVRICMFQGAPLADEVDDDRDEWMYPAAANE
ncbi:MAG: hypothetical protein AAGE89_08390 [Pseudomonadota bacterium]